MGLKRVISSDAPTADMLKYLRSGVGQARRDWLEATDMRNTRGRPDLPARLGRD